MAFAVSMVVSTAPSGAATTLRAVKLSLGTKLVSGSGAPGAAIIHVTWPGHRGRCSVDCVVELAPGDEVTVTGAAAAGYTFGGWSDFNLCPGTRATCTFSMPSSSVELDATVGVETHVLTVVPGSAGRISDLTGSIDCTRDATGQLTGSCSAEFRAGTRETLTVAPAAGKHFVGWSVWQCPAQKLTCTISLDAELGVTALMDPVVLSVQRLGPAGRVSSTPAGIDCAAGCQAGSAPFPFGDTVSLRAAPEAGTELRRWGAPCGGPVAECTLKLYTDTSTSAAFGNVAPPVNLSAPPTAGLSVGSSPSRSIATYAIVISAGPGGTVQLTSPGARKPITCQPNCARSYPSNASLNLRALANRKWKFSGWTGSCGAPKQPTCTVTPIVTSSVKATFRRVR